MTKYFRVEIEFDDETVADTVLNWLQGKVDGELLADKEPEGLVYLENNDFFEHPTIILVARFKNDTGRGRVFNFLKNKAKQSGVKEHILSAKVFRHECTVAQSLVDNGCVNELIFEYP